MSVFKVTMIFELGKNGWTESWYWVTGSVLQTIPPITVGNPQPDPIPALARWYDVCRARVNLLAQEGVLQALRVADVDVPRAALLDESVATMAPAVPLERDVKRRALRGTAQAGDGLAYRRVVTLRGVPDSFASRQASGQPRFGRAEGLFRTYRDKLIAAGACLRATLKDIDQLISLRIPISAVRLLGTPPVVVVTTSLAHGLIAGDRVRIRGVKFADKVASAPNFNATWYVAPYSGGGADPSSNFTIQYPIPAALGTPIPLLFGATEQKVAQTYPLLQSMLPDDWTSHKTGAPFGVGRGRSRARSTLLSIRAG